MIAYKFLDAGRVGPFTGFSWPLGEWVEASGADPCRSGIHACRVRDLPVWLGDELWEVDLDGHVVEQERKLVAPRGRLTRRLEEWNGDLAAARAAELRDGPAAYERERGLQAAWLAERLGLERPESL